MEKSNLEQKIAREKENDDSGLPAISARTIALLKLHGRLTISEIVTHTGANQNTLKVRLRELVDSGRIHRHGTARAIWYPLA